MSLVLVAPQWQGSGHPDARRLVDGAGRLARLVRPHPSVRSTPVSARRTPRRHDVESYDALVAARRTVTAALPDGPVLVIGGDCGADLAVVSRQLERRDGDLAILWLDAHADLNSPATSPSGAFHGMVLRALAGEGAPGLTAEVPADPSAVVLAGTRAVDPGEREWLAAAGVTPLGPAAVAATDPVVAAVRRTGRSAVHLHVDLDVLDPTEFPWTGYPEPDGPSVTEIARLIDAVAAAVPVSSAFVGEHLGSAEAGTEAAGPVVRSLLAAVTGQRPR
jgi:arginase